VIPLRLYLYAGIAALLVVGFFWYRHALIVEGEAKIIAADRAAADRQAKVDEAKLVTARTEHEKELAQIAAAQFDAGRTSVVCYSSRPVRPPVVSGGGSPAPAVVPADASVHPNVEPALFLLAKRADKLSADARELNAATH
jgi:hypothetical protein